MDKQPDQLNDNAGSAKLVFNMVEIGSRIRELL